MGLPLLAKDLIKETLMSVLVVPDVDASQLIGQAAIEVMYAVAGACSSGAILEANFHRSTSVAGVQGLRDSVVEVFCRCDRQIALANIESAQNIGILATLIFSGRTMSCGMTRSRLRWQVDGPCSKSTRTCR